jgi:hypothetical protein
MYNIEEAAPYVQAALKYSERPDLHIWFNRFPPPYLEGYEELIQDPYKLNDEARGRYEEYELWLTRRMPLSCRQVERCDRCYMQHFCDTLEHTMDRVRDDRFDAYRVELKDEENRDIPAPGPYGATWIVGEGIGEAASFAARVFTPNVMLELDSYAGFWAEVSEGQCNGKTVSRVIVERVEDLELIFSKGEPAFDVVVHLNHASAAWLRETLPEGSPRLILSLRNFERSSDAEASYPDLQEFFGGYSGESRVENIAPCISGAPSYQGNPMVLDSKMVRKENRTLEGMTPGDTGGRGSILKVIEKLDDNLSVGDPAKDLYIKELERIGDLHQRVDKGVLELFGYSAHYIENAYYTKSLRCKTCVHFDDCQGMHINYIRPFGYKALEPVSQ